MTMIDTIRQHKIAFLAGAIVIASIGGIVYYAYYMLVVAGKVDVEISLAPSDASLQVNGASEEPGSKLREPGVYKITASKKGYKSYSEEITVDLNRNPLSIPVTLQPESGTALIESEKYRDEYLRNEGIAGKQAQINGEMFRARNPIVAKLPYKTLLYTIGYRADNTDPTGNSIIIEVDAPEGLRDDVIAQISRWGYDPTDLNIRFRNYENPFAQ